MIFVSIKDNTFLPYRNMGSLGAAQSDKKCGKNVFALNITFGLSWGKRGSIKMQNMHGTNRGMDGFVNQ